MLRLTKCLALSESENQYPTEIDLDMAPFAAARAKAQQQLTCGETIAMIAERGSLSYSEISQIIGAVDHLSQYAERL